MNPPGARPRRIELGIGVEPAEAVRRVEGLRSPAVLSGEWLSRPGDTRRLTIIAADPIAPAGPDWDPFVVIGTQLLEISLPADPGVTIGGGWIGWVGYGAGQRAQPSGMIPPAPPRAPGQTGQDGSLAFYDHLVIHDGQGWAFEMLETAGRADDLAAAVERWRRLLTEDVTVTAAEADRPGPVLDYAGAGGLGHLNAVGECRVRIAAGDLYQANLCFGLTGQWEGSALELFACGLDSAAPRFGACLGGVISLSPERFLRRDGRQVWTEPMKGTRPRRGASEADEPARLDLLGAEKDAAEHVMIVDLMRNDLGRVCEYGSVSAEPPRAEPHAGVWQLVSTVAGRLRAGVGDGDLLAATFPPGSVTGAPKIAAMQLIAELESHRRGAYTGAVVIASPLAGLDSSVAIRTFELTDHRLWLGVGGGIVADSDPAGELAEALTKAAGPVSALGGRVIPDADARTATVADMSPGANGHGPDLERALAHGRRPDPAAGVFETLLAENGRPQFLSAHLRRLANSVSELYGLELAPDLQERVATAGAGLSRGRIRVIVRPDSGVEILATPEAPPDPGAPPLRLVPWLLAGGLGAHKFYDRDLLDALTTARPGFAPLLVDGDGTVLEAAWANVWIVEGDRWVTPPADGRILPGVTRAVLLLNPRVDTREESFGLDRLARADQIFLSSSVSGRRRAVFAGVPPELQPFSAA